jgi:hypothetical protein
VILIVGCLHSVRSWEEVFVLCGKDWLTGVGHGVDSWPRDVDFALQRSKVL